METTGFSPPCSAETSAQTTSSGSYHVPLPPTKGPTARDAAANPSSAVLVDSPSLSQVSVRSSEEEQEVMAMAVIIQRMKELKELEVLEAETKQRRAVLQTARSSRASSGRSGQAAASSGNAAGFTKSGRALVSGKTVQEEIAARARSLRPGEPRPTSLASGVFQKLRTTTELNWGTRNACADKQRRHHPECTRPGLYRQVVEIFSFGGAPGKDAPC